MEDKRVDFNTAKLAKEKGFDVTCDKMLSFYKEKSSRDGKEIKKGTIECTSNIINNNNCYSSKGLEKYALPTQSLLQKWLREKHHKRVEVKSYFVTELMYFVSINTNSKDYQFDKEFQTYEDALEFGLFECLQIISETVA